MLVEREVHTVTVFHHHLPYHLTSAIAATTRGAQRLDVKHQVLPSETPSQLRIPVLYRQSKVKKVMLLEGDVKEFQHFSAPR